MRVKSFGRLASFFLCLLPVGARVGESQPLKRPSRAVSTIKSVLNYLLTLPTGVQRDLENLGAMISDAQR